MCGSVLVYHVHKVHPNDKSKPPPSPTQNAGYGPVAVHIYCADV